MHPTVIAAIVAAMVSGTGWAITQIFALNRESVGREIAIRLRFLERQIEEFYGPLFSLTNQIQDAWDVRRRMIRASIATLKKGIQWDASNATWRISDEDKEKWLLKEEEIEDITDHDVLEYRDREPISTVRFYSLEALIFPLYEETNKILLSKLHLLNQPRMPDAYRIYMHHALQNRFQNKLYIDKGIASNFTAPVPYPREFTLEIERGLHELMAEYRRLQGKVADAANLRSLLRDRLMAAVGLNTGAPT